jgi:hypothetical protein
MKLPGFTADTSFGATTNGYWMANGTPGTGRNPVHPSFRIFRAPFTSSFGLSAGCYFYCSEGCAGSQSCLNECEAKCSGPISIF